jgi:hypothetical protein
MCRDAMHLVIPSHISHHAVPTSIFMGGPIPATSRFLISYRVKQTDAPHFPVTALRLLVAALTDCKDWVTAAVWAAVAPPEAAAA